MRLRQPHFCQLILLNDKLSEKGLMFAQRWEYKGIGCHFFPLKVFLLGRRGEVAINLSVAFLEVTLKVGILKASYKWQ